MRPPGDELIQQLNDAGILAHWDYEAGSERLVLRFASGRKFQVEPDFDVMAGEPHLEVVEIDRADV